MLRSESAQSFTLWRQATIEITCHDHSIIICSRPKSSTLFLLLLMDNTQTSWAE